MVYNQAVPNARTPLSTTGFLLSKIGQIASDRFAEKLAPLGIRPRHAGLLAATASLSEASQDDLSRAVGLVPSAIVKIVDELEGLEAVKRVTDETNRRRYSIEITKSGKALLARCTEAANAVDREILSSLPGPDRAALTQLLRTLGGAFGLTPGLASTRPPT